MRKTCKTAVFMLALGIISSPALAQNNNVVSAYNYKEKGEFAEAREYIDQAIDHEKTRDKEKTWRYRGEIYLGIATSEDEALRNSVPNALETAYESFKRAEELDPKGSYEVERKALMARVNNVAINRGIEAFNEKDFSKATKLFSVGAEAASALGVVDTNAIYNAGLSAEQAKDYETALKHYGHAADLKYQGPKMHLYVANIHQEMKDTAGYLAAVQKGRALYPEDKDLIIYELNYYLQNKKFQEAEDNLKLAIEKDPQNKLLHFSLGFVYDQLGDYENASETYKKALAIDPEYFDANYNLGALIFNKGVEQNNAANSIEDNKAYAAAKEEAKKVFKESLPYLEKAHQLEPEDANTIQSLTQLYALLGENEKYAEMKAKAEGK